ncbi:MAG: phosphoglycolate phosphatase, partial [Nitrosomonas halophila]
MIEAILFDFDGTVADTAPDLGHALNRQRTARNQPPLPIEQIRTEASG